MQRTTVGSPPSREKRATGFGSFAEKTSERHRGKRWQLRRGFATGPTFRRLLHPSVAFRRLPPAFREPSGSGARCSGTSQDGGPPDSRRLIGGRKGHGAAPYTHLQ